MTLPRNVSLVANTPLTVDLSGEANAHTLLRVTGAPSAGLIWATTDGSTPVAYADGVTALGWYTPDVPSSGLSGFLEVPDSKSVKLLASGATTARLDQVPPSASPKDLDGGYGVTGRATYPTLTHGVVATITLTGIAPVGRWVRVDLPVTATAWATLDGTTPSSGVGSLTNTYGACSRAVQVPTGGTLKVWASFLAGSGTTRMRVAQIAEPHSTELWAV